MSDLFRNHIVGFPTRWLKFYHELEFEVTSLHGQARILIKMIAFYKSRVLLLSLIVDKSGFHNYP